MKLYPIPGGTWAGTEADWKAAMKAKGLNPKDFDATKTREVPTGKKELMEFLTFFAVDPYRLPGGATTVSEVDVEALRAQHNPGSVVSLASPENRMASDTAALTASAGVPLALAEMFRAAPINLQLELAVSAIDAAGRRINGGS